MRDGKEILWYPELSILNNLSTTYSQLPWRFIGPNSLIELSRGQKTTFGVQLCIILLWPAYCYSISWAELFIFYKYRIYPANSNFLLLYHSNKKCGWNYDDARIQQLMVILWWLFWLYDTTWMLAWNLHIFA